MASSESDPKNSNEETTNLIDPTTLEEQPQSVIEDQPQSVLEDQPQSVIEESSSSQCSEKVLSGDVKIRREITTKTKRVSFHFGTKDTKNVTLNTIQNIYDSKTDENEASLVRNNSRLNKSAYIKLHRHSFSSVGNSTVDKLKGRYENIAKQTDNNLKANTVRAKANTDNTSTSKNSDESDKQEEENTPKSKSESLKAEFINSTPEQPDSSNSALTISKSSESLQQTTSNIEKLQNNLTTRLSNDTIEKLRSKYSPASFGYPRNTRLSFKKPEISNQEQTKIPVPTPRISIKSEDVKKDDLVTCEPPNKEDIKTVSVKLVSVPDEPTIEEETKDENSNVVVTEEVTTKPVVPSKPKQLFKDKEVPPDLIQDQEEPHELEIITGVELEVTYDNIEFAEPEEKHFIVCRSSSEDSIYKFENSLADFIMDKKPKEKKRSNSFRKILTGGFFGRDKKKPEEDKAKNKKKDNVFSDNAQNESQAFDRNSSHRHTIDNSFPRRELQRKNTYPPESGPLYYYSPQTQLRKGSEDTTLRHRYTEMKGKDFVPNNNHKYSPEDYVPMDNGSVKKRDALPGPYMNVSKYIDTSSSSSNTLDSENRNCTYQNALIAQAEMRQIRENENLHRNTQRSGIPVNVNRRTSPGFHENRLFKHSDSPEMFRESPQDSSQNLQLVKPKALIPINSERPLPNPFRNNQEKSEGDYENLDNSKTLDRNLNIDNSKPYPHKNNLYGKTTVVPDKKSNQPIVVDDTYGTVFDSISPQANLEHPRTRRNLAYGRTQSPLSRTTTDVTPVVQASPNSQYGRTQSPPTRLLEYSMTNNANPRTRVQSPVQTNENLEYGRTKNPPSRKLEYLTTNNSTPRTRVPLQTSPEHLGTKSPPPRSLGYSAPLDSRTGATQSPPPRSLGYSSPLDSRTGITQSPPPRSLGYSSPLDTRTGRIQSPPPRSLEHSVPLNSRTEIVQSPPPRSLGYSAPLDSRSGLVQSPPPRIFDYSASLDSRTRSLSPQHSQRSGSNCSSPSSRIPTSPRSLEASKLRLPSNREKIDLQPRIRSPIPQTKVSTEKIIATELLRNKNSPVQERPRPKTVSPNIYENNLSSPDNRRVTSPPAHSTPQSFTDGGSTKSDYINLNSPIVLRNKPPLSPREASGAECLQAAEWQRHQRELDKSPALETPQQITTNVMVHANPEGDLYVSRHSLPPSSSQRSLNKPYGGQGQASPRSIHSSLNNVRPHTPIQQAPPCPNSKSPEKQHMLHNVEAFYWRELRKLKDKEEQDLLNYRQQQFYVYGYVEDPVMTRRSRSVSPSMHRGRRSLSLPRDVRPTPGRGPMHGPESIPEGRPVIAKKPITLPTESAYGQVRQPVQRNPNFIRNTFERSTIGPIGVNNNSQIFYENYVPGPRSGSRQGYTPIFKRGSLTGNLSLDSQYPGSKKVSFVSTQNASNPTSWPTKNGFTKSPPTRRIEREISAEDDVFLPNTPKSPPYRNMEEIYVRSNTEVDSKPIPKQQIYQNQNQFSRPPRYEAEHAYRERESMEPLYGRAVPKQITVSNKVCDIYGQIHEPVQKSPNPQNYGQIKQIGYMYGQIQPHPNQGSSPVVLRQSFNQLNSPQNNFVRGTRLTASANDMYRRYPVYEIDPRYQTSAIYSSEAPQRPLPPVPERKDSRLISARKIVRGYAPISDTESGSEAGEVQRILQSGTRTKNFSVIGK